MRRPESNWMKVWLACACLMFAVCGRAAGVEVLGVKNDKLLKNVRAHIDTIELPVAAYQYEQYQQRVAEKVVLALQVFGYYHSDVKVSGPADKAKSGNWQVEVTLGPPTLIRELHIALDGPGADNPVLQQKLAALPLKSGQTLQHEHYEASKAQMHNLALALGYFDFEFSKHSIKVYQSSYSANITLAMNTGQRYHFGELRFPEDERAKALVIDALPFAIGEPYSAEKIALLNQRLKLTQYFRQVLVRPVVADAQDHAVPIEIILTHKPRDNYDLGAGISSDIGPRFTAKWQRPWVNNKGHAMGAELFLSEPERSISLDYRIPLEDPVQNYASFQVGYQTQNENDTRSDKFTLAAFRHWTVPDSDWQRTVFLRLEQETYIQGLEPEQTTRLLTPGLTLSRLRSLGGLDIYWGDKQSITLETAADSLFSDINLLRVTAQSKWLRSWNEHRLLFRADYGAIATEDFDQVPSSLRYFAGGDQSIRGFGYRTISPSKLNDEGQPELVGGRYLAVGSVEYSYPFAQNWRGAVFVDAGTSTNKFGGEIATGIGIGVHWLTLIGPVRLYLARGNSDYESAWRIHFAMGPAL